MGKYRATRYIGTTAIPSPVLPQGYLYTDLGITLVTALWVPLYRTRYSVSTDIPGPRSTCPSLLNTVSRLVDTSC